MSHDALSDVLRSVRLRSAVFYYVSCGDHWAAEAPGAKEIAQAVMPGTEHVIEYHVITKGECWAAVVGEPPLKIRQGDTIMLPHGDAHVISSAAGLRAKVDISWLQEMKLNRRPFCITYQGLNGPQVMGPKGADIESADSFQTSLVCGFIGCDTRPFNPLIATLPRLLHLPASGNSAFSEQFIKLAATESARRSPGGEALLERMSEMLFVDAVRQYVDTLPESSKGWLAGLRDRCVGRALALLHERPAAQWNIDELSKQVGLSRSALHERFVEFIGLPPVQYLTNWRMQLASRLLRDTQSSVASIALEVGYDSEPSFARAFKRLVGMPPATWRRAQARKASNINSV